MLVVFIPGGVEDYFFRLECFECKVFPDFKRIAFEIALEDGIVGKFMNKGAKNLLRLFSPYES